ncbi:hypothetical protein OIU78_012713 [Salix suchowensis]|nr:hypothetical protein OIU78_012713 [Salix suchowensis]
MSNNKMKGLLKGLRYISQIFDNDEKKPEMQIGYPTDVKHVAHIGWDGPSVNSPSWMTEFKSPPEYSSAPLSLDQDSKEEGSVKWASEGSSRKGSRAPNSRADGVHRTVLRLNLRARKNQINLNNLGGLHEMAPKTLLDGSKTSRSLKDPSVENEQPSDLPEIPKKTRRKKSKDASVGGKDASVGGSSSRSRSRSKALASEGGGESELISKSCNSGEQGQTRASSPSRDGEKSGFSGIS